MIDARTALLVALAALSTASSAIAESAYPTPRDGRERIQRTGTCPVGYVGKGQFCEALRQDVPRAYPYIPGTACPPRTFRSGDACVSFR